MFCDRCILRYNVLFYPTIKNDTHMFTIFLGFRKVSPSMADANASDETIELKSETKNVEVDQGSEKSSIQSTCPKA